MISKKISIIAQNFAVSAAAVDKTHVSFDITGMTFKAFNLQIATVFRKGGNS